MAYRKMGMILGLGIYLNENIMLKEITRITVSDWNEEFYTKLQTFTENIPAALPKIEV